MSNLLSKRYNSNKVKTQANASKGKDLAAKQKVVTKKENVKKLELENVKVMKDVKVLPLD